MFGDGTQTFTVFIVIQRRYGGKGKRLQWLGQVKRMDERTVRRVVV